MRSDRGFAMADALIAMIIVSLFAISLIAANTLMLRSIDNASSRLNATLLARSLIEERPSETSGERMISGKHYAWTLATSGGQSGRRHSVLGKEDISVRIDWEGLTTTQTIEIKTTRLRVSNG